MTSPQPALVSVIIPFLNHGAWLAEAVESVIGQSYPHCKILLIDDGSEEEASWVGREYGRKSPKKITYLDHPGHVSRGVTASRNAGVRRSSGGFIAFLDSDDCWLEDKLRFQLDLFERYPAAGVVCEASRFWYSWADPARPDTGYLVGAPPDRLYSTRALDKILYPLGTGAPPCPTGVMVRREAFDRSGGFEEIFSGQHQLYEDQAFLGKLYLREKVYVSGTAHNLYRKRPGSRRHRCCG